MPRTKTQQQSEAALADAIEQNSQGNTRAAPASKKKAAAKKTGKKTASKKQAAKKTPNRGTTAGGKKKASATSGEKKAYGRKHALYDALKAGGTRDEVAEELNRLYVKNGGSDNPTNSRNWVSTFVPILEHFGAVKRDKDGRLSLTK